MNSESAVGVRRDNGFFRAYSKRVFWYLGIVLMAFGAMGLPPSRFPDMLVPGLFQYLEYSIPLSLVTVASYVFMEVRLPEKMFGLRPMALAWLVTAIGVVMVAVGLFTPWVLCGTIGVSVICSGGELRCDPDESAYWEAWRTARKGRK